MYLYIVLLLANIHFYVCLDPILIFNPAVNDRDSTKKSFAELQNFLKVDINFPLLTPSVTMTVWIHPMGIISFQSPAIQSPNLEMDITNISSSVLAAYYSQPKLSSGTLRYKAFSYVDDLNCMQKVHLERYEKQIQMLFPNGPLFKTRGLVIINWDDMENPLARNRKNSIEVILLSDYAQTYAIWHFVNISWTGSGTNNRFMPKAGMFTTNQNSIPLPLSNTSSMPSDWEVNTNCFVSGEWILKIGDNLVGPNPDESNPTSISNLIFQMKRNLSLCSSPSEEGCRNCDIPDVHCVTVKNKNCCLCKPGFIGDGKQCINRDSGFNMMLNIQFNHNLVPGRGNTQGLVTLSVTRYSNLMTFSSFLDSTSQNILSTLLPLYFVQASIFGKPVLTEVPSLYFLTNGYFEMSFQLNFNASNCGGITINMNGSPLTNFNKQKLNEVAWKVNIIRNTRSEADCILDNDFFEYVRTDRNYEFNAIVENSGVTFPQQSLLIQGRKSREMVTVSWSATLITEINCLMEKNLYKPIYMQLSGGDEQFCRQTCRDGGFCDLNCLSDPLLYNREPGPPSTGCDACPPEATCVENECQCPVNYKLTDSGCLFDCESCSSRPNFYCTGNSCACIKGYQLDPRGTNCVAAQAQCTRVEDCQENEHCSSEGRCLCPSRKLSNGKCLPLDSYECCSKKLLERPEMGECAADGVSCQCRSGLKDYLRENYCQECRGSDCHQDAVCVPHESWAYYHCKCKPGFVGDGYACVSRDSQSQIKSCDECHNYAQCEKQANLPVKCTCIPGYQGNGKECYPVLAGSCDCAYLQNPRSAYCNSENRCNCRPGTMPGPSNECKECSTNPSLCHLQADCIANATIGYNYCECKSGYTGNGFNCVRKADERDPCFFCPPDARCVEGRCICPITSQLINDICVPKKFCITRDDCPENQVCSEGLCTCPYSFLNGKCPATPSARCNPACDINAVCNDGVCQCKPGFIGDGIRCGCPDGYIKLGPFCEKIEYKVTIRPNQEIIRKEPGDTLELMCIYNTNDPQAKPIWSRRPAYVTKSLDAFSVDYSATEKALRMQVKENDQGVYRCSLGNQKVEVAIIVQDRRCSKTCHVFARCNYSGECQCQEGYMGDGVTECFSRDCSVNPGICPPDSRCIEGQCQCRNGFEMKNDICVQGRNCLLTRDCDRNAKCVVEDDIPYCKCNLGYYKQNGYCTLDVGCNLRRNCANNAECVLRGRRFVCVCKNNFVGSGYTSCQRKIDCGLQPKPCGPNSLCEVASYSDNTTGETFFNGRCICQSGFTLANNTCIETRKLNFYFYTASGDALFKVPLVSSANRQSEIYRLDLDNGFGGIIATASDCKRRRIFWSSSNGRKITYSAENDPESLEIYSEGQLIESMSVDYVSGNLFFLDSRKSQLSVINPANKAVQIIFSSDRLNRPKSLALDLEQRKLYFTSISTDGQARIEVSNYDGSDRRLFLNLSRPAIALTMDLQTQRLCWIKSSDKSIRSPFRFKRELFGEPLQDHGQIQCVSVRPGDEPTIRAITSIDVTPPSIGLVVDDGVYYWTDRVRRQINQFVSGRLLSLPVTPSCCGKSTYGLAILKDRCPLYSLDSQACSDLQGYGFCDQVCLSKSDGSRKCYCPDNRLPCGNDNSITVS